MLTLGRLKDDYSVLSPLTGLRGRNGGLGLKCRWRALWAIGVKVVSLKSTFWGFWWIWVVGSLSGSTGRVGFALYMRRPLVGGAGLYMAGGGHLWGLGGFGWGAVGAVSLGGFKLFSTLFIYFDLGVDSPIFAPRFGDVATFFDSPTTTSPQEILAVRRSGESASDSFA